MDVMWFKKQQKKAGVTTADIAKRLGRDRSVVSHIYTGRQRMSLEWAKAFAETLEVPLDEVLKRAGALDEPRARELQPGFSDSDAAVWRGQETERRKAQSVTEALGLDRPGIDIWQVKSLAMSLQGLLPGDMMAVDQHAAEHVRAGDTVIAQRYDHTLGVAVTLLRRFEPPVLVAASVAADDRRVHVVDGNNIVIRGKIVASWRE
ncbi:helix-turn-helix transcriptional regulator [Meridianimarinicoccus sp. RP-17]|uniref:helix-turn-helix transcriptional regulator n=1 Tax=Meridianimarinicoccus zhengii TaxID=2056810 RepID=UPI000DADC89B|nr:helix-turn-helix transcriptional regulator [Phycocomes zhengii]